MTQHDAAGYPHPLIERYASSDMAELFSPRAKALQWRDLWIALAEIERELDVPVPGEAVQAMREGREEIDLGRVAELEKELRHDVMAHVHHFGEVAPAARGHIHLGATSAFVTDNADLLRHREALRLVRRRLLAHRHARPAPDLALPATGPVHPSCSQDLPAAPGRRAAARPSTGRAAPHRAAPGTATRPRWLTARTTRPQHSGDLRLGTRSRRSRRPTHLPNAASLAPNRPTDASAHRTNPPRAATRSVVQDPG